MVPTACLRFSGSDRERQNRCSVSVTVSRNRQVALLLEFTLLPEGMRGPPVHAHAHSATFCVEHDLTGGRPGEQAGGVVECDILQKTSCVEPRAEILMSSHVDEEGKSCFVVSSVGQVLLPRQEGALHLV